MSVETRFHVQMACAGCANACRRILSKIDGVSDMDISVEDQRIVVKHAETVSRDAMLEALRKWGAASKRTVEFEADAAGGGAGGGAAEGSA